MGVGKGEFEKFLEGRESAKKEAAQINWKKQKEEWLDQLKAFYEKILSFTESYRESGKIGVTWNRITLTEENIGDYKVDELNLDIEGSKVTFHPVGTLLIGAKGRVDMTAQAGTVRFVLVNKSSSRPRVIVHEITPPKSKRVQKETKPNEPSELAWKIATSPPQIRYIDLDEESFFTSLMAGLNG